MNTGDRIKQKRIELGLTVDELAQKIGKSRATIYRYENGDIENMPTPILEPLAKALETTPADLMGWTNIKASGTITLYNVQCETKDEAELILSYRKLSLSGQKRVSSYTSKLLDIEKADVELNAAHHSRGNFTDEERQADEDMLD